MPHLTVDTSRTTEQRLPMSYADFCALDSETTHAEWVDGEVILFMLPTTRQQQLVGFLAYLLTSCVHMFQLGEVITAPFEMRLVPGRLSREPDILFVARANRHRLTAERLEGAADLVVEIVSPESATRDQQTKFQEYQQHGVGEYWLIDPRPNQQRVVCYQRGADGNFAAATSDAAGRLHSGVLPDFWLHPDWLWQEPLPDPLATFLQMRGLSPDALGLLRPGEE